MSGVPGSDVAFVKVVKDLDSVVQLAGEKALVSYQEHELSKKRCKELSKSEFQAAPMGRRFRVMLQMHVESPGGEHFSSDFLAGQEGSPFFKAGGLGNYCS